METQTPPSPSGLKALDFLHIQHAQSDTGGDSLNYCQNISDEQIHLDFSNSATSKECITPTISRNNQSAVLSDDERTPSLQFKDGSSVLGDNGRTPTLPCNNLSNVISGEGGMPTLRYNEPECVINDEGSSLTRLCNDQNGHTRDEGSTPTCPCTNPNTVIFTDDDLCTNLNNILIRVDGSVPTPPSTDLDSVSRDDESMPTLPCNDPSVISDGGSTTHQYTDPSNVSNDFGSTPKNPNNCHNIVIRNDDSSPALLCNDSTDVNCDHGSTAMLPCNGSNNVIIDYASTQSFPCDDPHSVIKYDASTQTFACNEGGDVIKDDASTQTFPCNGPHSVIIHDASTQTFPCNDPKGVIRDDASTLVFPNENQYQVTKIESDHPKGSGDTMRTQVHSAEMTTVPSYSAGLEGASAEVPQAKDCQKHNKPLFLNQEINVDKASEDDSNEATDQSAKNDTEPTARWSGGSRKPRKTEPDKGWAWMVLLAAFLSNLIFDGAIYSCGVFYLEFLDAFGEGHAKTSLVGSTVTAMYFLTGPIARPLAQKIGCRLVCICGSIVSAVGFILCSFSPNIWIAIFTYSVLGGFGFGLMHLCSFAMIGYYFEQKRVLANTVAMCGSGLGTVLFAPLFTALVQTFRWRGAMWILAGVVLNGVVMGSLYRPLVPESTHCVDTTAKGKHLLDFKLLRKFVFVACCSSSFLCLIGFFVPFIYLPHLARSQNITRENGSFVISIIGVTYTIGQIFCGYIYDKPWADALKIFNSSMVIGGIAATTWTLLQTLPLLATVGAVYGFCIAAYVSLAPIILVKFLGEDKLWDSLGFLGMFRGIASFIGIPFAGWMYDITGDYHVSFYIVGGAIILGGLVCLPLRVFHRCQDKSTRGLTSDATYNVEDVQTDVKGSKRSGTLAYTT